MVSSNAALEAFGPAISQRGFITINFQTPTAWRWSLSAFRDLSSPLVIFLQKLSSHLLGACSVSLQQPRVTFLEREGRG
jgi:hypothetical protein